MNVYDTYVFEKVTEEQASNSYDTECSPGPCTLPRPGDPSGGSGSPGPPDPCTLSMVVS